MTISRSFSTLSLDEFQSQKKKIKCEIKSRPQGQDQGKKLTKQLSNHSFLAVSKSSVEEKVKQLLQFVVDGNQANAEYMLIKHPLLLPLLLTQKDEVMDHSRRKIFATALQIAMGAKDVRYHADEECMVEMLQKYFKKLQNGDLVMAGQIAEQFPDGFAEQEIARQVSDRAALNKVIDVIAKSECDDDCTQALHEFLAYLKSQTASTITSGYHFNDQLLITALERYNPSCRQFVDQDQRKSSYFKRNVIGNIVQYLPASWAEAICQGVHNIVEENEKLSRTWKFSYCDQVVFYRPETDPDFRLGDDFVDGWHIGGRERALRVFKNLCQTKYDNTVDIYKKAIQTCVALARWTELNDEWRMDIMRPY